jgi:SAM-dependent methyltransferase
MATNKNHWYDGWFYDTIIAPNQDKLFRQIKNLVEPDTSIIDIGCGTGRLGFALADKCKSVLGIDLSKKNINRANLTLLQHPNVKVSFKHNNLSEIISNRNIHFDYAILTYVIHEVNEEEREDLLRNVALIADKIIVGDYLVPRTKGFGSYFSDTVEFIAGKEHYRNFKSFVACGGIYYLADKAGLKVIDEITNQPLSNHIVILAK